MEICKLLVWWEIYLLEALERGAVEKFGSGAKSKRWGKIASVRVEGFRGAC